MSPGRRDEDDADTPPTRSYVDALLNQSLSVQQLAHLRAEIVKHEGELPDDDEDEGGQQTRFHSCSEAERRSAAPAAADDDDDDEQRTRFHSYSEAERRSAAPAAAGDDDDDEQRTRFHSYSETERRSARPAPDDDDARTLYRPPSRQPPMPPSAPRTSDRAPPRSVQPASSDRLPRLSQSSQRIPHLTSSDRLPLVDLEGRTPPPVELELPPSVRAPMPTIDLDVPMSLPTPPPYEHEVVPLSAPTPGKLDTRAIDKTYLDAVGGPGGIPRLAVSPAKLTTLSLQPQAGFLLSMIDGQSTVEDLIDISSLSRIETLRMLYHLLQQGVVSVDKR